jgi:hypothetical protein
MREEDEEGEKAEKARKNWVGGEVLHLIALQGEMELEFTKNVKKKPYNYLLDLIFALFS